MSRWMGRKEREKRARAVVAKAFPDASRRFTLALAGASADLELHIEGKVVRPSDPEYAADRMSASSAEFAHFPLLIAYCETFADVRHCLRCARDNQVPVALRASGHHTAGYSVNDGLVIDVSPLEYVLVDPAQKTALVGAGTRCGHLNTALDLYGLHVPSGGCHDVRVAGFLQGGGYGYTSRMFGMNCDSALEATVMLADGGLVTASRTVNPDLFWALRGGTGGNFGVLLQVKYQLRETGPLSGFRAWWALDPEDGVERAARILEYLQACHMRHDGGAKALGYQAFIAWQKSADDGLNLDGWYLLVRGMYQGSDAELATVLQPLVDVAKPFACVRRPGSYRELDLFTHEKPDVPQVDDAAREEKQSAYIATAVQADGWAEIISCFLRTPNRGNLLAIEPYGGRINEAGVHETAFSHRRVDMDLYVDVFWLDEAKKEEARSFLSEFMTFVESRHGSGRSYQNYPRATQTDYRERYWAEAFPTLRAIKRKYDPGDFFRYPQGVLPLAGHPDHDDPPPGQPHPKVFPDIAQWLRSPIAYSVEPERQPR